MSRLVSERERKLQLMLIPVNIVVCILAIVATISLLLSPILKIDVGKILRDENTIGYVDEIIDNSIKTDLENTQQKDIDYKPVVAMLVKSILGKAEGEISITAISSFRVLTAGENKTQKVLDELLFGDKALATKLINSVVEGVAEMFSTDEGRTVLEEAILSTLTSQIIDSVDNKELADAINKNIKELTEIFKELGNEEAALDNGASVAQKLVDKLEESLGGDTHISEANRQSVIDHITGLYEDTKAELKEGESVSSESIICVTISNKMDISKLNIGDFLGGVFSKDNGENGNEESIHTKSVDGEVGGEDSQEGTGDGDQDGTDGEQGDGETGGETDGETGDGQDGETGGSKNKIVTTYDDLLLEMGFDREAKENLKESMRETLNTQLNDFVNEKGIGNYLKYYQYVFFFMLFFMILWLLMFLFAFIHLFGANKRFATWYVKFLCWIPAMVWVILALIPAIAPKIGALKEFWNGNSIGKAVFGGISSFTWISGLCYVILWAVWLFWAFPIRHMIKKERTNPRREPDYDDYDDYDDDDDDF